MTPRSFERMREEERRLREVMVACAAVDPRTRRFYRGMNEAIAEAWVEYGGLANTAGRIQRSRERVRRCLNKLRIGQPGRGSFLFAGRSVAVTEPEWRYCERCGEVIPFTIGMSVSQYARRTRCSFQCCGSTDLGSAQEACRRFTDAEMLNALERFRHVKRAAASLGVTRCAVVNRCGMLFIREFLGASDD